MGVNKAIVGDEVMFDLTADTVSEANLLAGATAHNAAGEPITGVVVTVPVDSELSEESANAIQNKAVAKAVKGGETLSGSTSYTVNDSVEYPLVGLKVFGKSTQDGTPTPENPVEITSVVEPTVTVSNDNDSVSMTLPYTLNAIPVSSGGNVTIDGQEYIADYVDFERGVKVQRVKKVFAKNLTWEKSSSSASYMHYMWRPAFEDSLWKNSELVVCPYYKSTIYQNIENRQDKTIYAFNGNSGATIAIFDNSIETLDDFISFIESNNVEIMFVRPVPIETPLSETELQAYRQLQTYNGTTNISNDKGAGLSVEYCTNKALSACVAPITTGLQKQIDDLKSAVLSLGGNV